MASTAPLPPALRTLPLAEGHWCSHLIDHCLLTSDDHPAPSDVLGVRHRWRSQFPITYANHFDVESTGRRWARDVEEFRADLLAAIANGSTQPTWLSPFLLKHCDAPTYQRELSP